jgi:hypothetical protein
MDSATLIIGVLAGAVGMGYFIYGKKQAKAVPLLCGLGLCVIPYFINNVILLIVTCLAMIIAPFII